MADLGGGGFPGRVGDQPARVVRGGGVGVQGVQGEVGAGVAEVVLDGLITNGKFCCVRRVRLSLTWWRLDRPEFLGGCDLWESWDS